MDRGGGGLVFSILIKALTNRVQILLATKFIRKDENK